MRVELVYFAGCPNVDRVRSLLLRCAEWSAVAPEIVEIDTSAPGTPERYRHLASPTVLVDGADVLGGKPADADSCRLQLPTEAELTFAWEAALRHAERAAVVGGSLTAIGATVVAIFGTLCCAGPVAVVLLGVGGAVATARFEPYRPYFIAMSIVLLAFGFWRLRRARRYACLSRREAMWLPRMLWLGAILTALTAALTVAQPLFVWLAR
jgi:mercuric ion transport protein